MADLIVTAMVPPQRGVTYTTRDGTPYRAESAEGIVQVRPEHVADLTAQGFTTATAAQVHPGDDLQEDVGWSEDPGAALQEQ